MEPTVNPVNLIQYVPQPAFLVKDGMIVNANSAAVNLQIKAEMPVAPLIATGAEEYQAFTSGKLYLRLTCGQAWVSVCEDCHLFCVEESYASPHLRAFALAAQNLRLPLSNAVTGAELLAESESIRENPELRQQLGQLNRSLYQMIREICNMSDVSELGTQYNKKLTLQNVTAVFDEIFQKASAYTLEHGHTLKFKNLKSDLDCAIDASLLERAVLNLVSNAVKFSPANSTIEATLKQSNHKWMLTVENGLKGDPKELHNNAFSRFLREPGIDSSEFGIGLGMSIISRAVSAHQGTVLLTTQKKNVRICICAPITTNIDTGLESPVLLPESYTGGIDSYLVELSEVLPSHYYEYPDC